MNLIDAKVAIEEILASIPDDELPSFDRAEIVERGKVCVWFGGKGRYLGSARSGGQRNPIQYREHAAWDAIEGEMAYRADRAFLANGDKPDGLRLAKRMTNR